MGSHPYYIRAGFFSSDVVMGWIRHRTQIDHSDARCCPEHPIALMAIYQSILASPV